MITLNVKRKFIPNHIIFVKVKINDDGRYGQITEMLLYDVDTFTTELLDVNSTYNT